MKRCFAVLLAFALLLSTISFSAFATEENQADYASLIQKASTAFPEYANKMQNPTSSADLYSPNTVSRELVVSETRAVSDQEYITYSEYSDGLILLSGTNLVADTTTVSNVSGSTYRNITINIEAAYVGDRPGYFYLNGVSYSLRDSDYDIITSAGTSSRSGSCTSATRARLTSRETDTSYAQIIYNLEFVVGPTEYYTILSTLYFYVGCDSATIDHVSRG